MLGFSPLASMPLAGAGQILVSVLSPLTSTGGLTFGGTATTGSYVGLSSTGGVTFAGVPSGALGSPITSTGGLRFRGSPQWTLKTGITASGGISFSGSPMLRVAGRAVRITALPDNHKIRAIRVTYAIVALPDNFRLRGVP